MKQLITVLIIVTICAAPSIAGAQIGWPMFQGNAAHTGYVPVSFDPNNLTLDWEVTLSPDKMDVQQVAAADGYLFVTMGESGVAINEDLFALDPTDGTILWSKNYVDAYSVSPPTYDDHRVYVQVTDGMQDAHLYVYNSTGGNLIDDAPFTSLTARYLAPVVVSGTAYIAGSLYGGMYAFNFMEEPNQRWFKEVHDYDAWTPAVDGLFAYAYTGPIVGLMGQLTVVRCSNGAEVFAITDSEHYHHELPRRQYLAPVLGGQDDALVIQRGELVSFDLGSRNIRYEIPGGFGYANSDDGTFPDFSIASEQPSVANGRIYAVKNRNLVVLDQSDGSEIWSWIPPDSGKVTNNIVVTDTHAFVVVPKRLPYRGDPGLTSIHAVNLTTHSSDWSHDLAYTYGDLAWSEGRLYFAREDGVLSALKLVGSPVQSSVVQLATTAFSVAEDAGTAAVTLRRTGSGNGTVSVKLATEDGTAMAGSDYTAVVDQVVTWGHDETTDKTVYVSITDDSATESAEYLDLKLHTATGASIGVPNRAQLTIFDDETGSFRFTAAGADVSEGGGTVTISVARDGPDTDPVTVNYATADGTADDVLDYTAKSGALSWAGGDGADKTITVSILDDGIDEDNETFTVSLSNPSVGTIIGTPSVFTVTVVDDDGPRVHFGTSFYQVDETGGTVDLTVNRSGNTVGAVSVDWATGGGSATPGQDYVADSGTLIWPSGNAAVKTITLTVLDDSDTEGGETFQVTLSNPAGVIDLGRPAVAAVSIVDNEALESLINTTVDFGQIRPRVAMDATGSAVVVWESSNQDGSGWGVFGQRLDADGDPVGSEFRVNVTTAGDQKDAAVTMTADGGFVVVWQGDATGGTDIFGRRYNASGVSYGDEFVVNTSASGSQTAPRVAVDGAGRFMVVWESSDDSLTGVFARVFSAAGSPLGGEVQVNTTTAGSQAMPAVAGFPVGGFVVVWESYYQDGSLDAVIGRFFAGSGAALNDEFLVNESIAWNQSIPGVAVVEDGSFLVVWEDDAGLDGAFGSIRGRWFDVSASPLGGGFQINTYGAGDQRRPSVAAEPDGRAVVVWESRTGQDGSGFGVYGRAMVQDGGFLSEELQLNTHTAGSQYLPGVACSEAGTFVTVWTSQLQDGSGDGVYGVVWPLPPLPLIFADGFESGNTSAW